MGQGFGAGVLLSFLVRNPGLRVAGVVTTAALIETHEINSYNWVVRWMVKEMLAGVYGDLCFNARMNPTSLFKNNYNIRKYMQDPLINPVISLKMLKSVSDILDCVLPNAKK